MERETKTWSAQDAKAKFSEVLDGVESGLPQVITRHGRKIAKVVPFDQNDEEEENGASIVEMLERSPLRNSGLKLRRSGRVSASPRKIDL
jgi:prevent-host-death family protein